MKKTWWIAAAIVCLLCVLAPAAWGAGASVTLEWDPNSEADLAGYKMYYGNSPRPADATRAGNPYPNTIDVKNVTVYTVAGLGNGNWCFAATAYNTGGAESEFSNEVCTSLNVPPGVPSTLRITAVVTVDVKVTQ